MELYYPWISGPHLRFLDDEVSQTDLSFFVSSPCLFPGKI